MSLVGRNLREIPPPTHGVALATGQAAGPPRAAGGYTERHGCGGNSTVGGASSALRITRDRASLRLGTCPQNWKPGPQETLARPCSLRYSPEPRHGSTHGGPDGRADKHNAASRTVGQYPTLEEETGPCCDRDGPRGHRGRRHERQPQKDKQRATHSQEGPRPVRSAGTGRRRWVPGAWGRGVAGKSFSTESCKVPDATVLVAAPACERRERSHTTSTSPARGPPQGKLRQGPRPPPPQVRVSGSLDHRRSSWEV